MTETIPFNEDLKRSLRHPVFWLVNIIRIVAGFLFFWDPLVGWLVMVILDILDGQIFMHGLGMSQAVYHYTDKIFDMIVFGFMLVVAIGAPYFWLVAVLFGYRLVGQIIYFINKNENWLLFFVNFFEVAWLWAIIIPSLVLPLNWGFMYGFGGLVLMFTVKVFQELLLHTESGKVRMSRLRARILGSR